jgi:hypothetical protein
MEQLLDNIRAGDESWQLSADQLKRLTEASDIVPLYPYSLQGLIQQGRHRNGPLVI